MHAENIVLNWGKTIPTCGPRAFSELSALLQHSAKRAMIMDTFHQG